MKSSVKTSDILVPVTVIADAGKSILVQYVDNGMLTRKTVPAHMVRNNQVYSEVLSQGIPFGYPFEEMPIEFNAQKFANELHNLGIWSVEDLLKQPRSILSALNAGFADNVANVLEIAKQEKKGVTHG
jgi:hypothetical protein